MRSVYAKINRNSIAQHGKPPVSERNMAIKMFDCVRGDSVGLSGNQSTDDLQSVTIRMPNNAKSVDENACFISLLTAKKSALCASEFAWNEEFAK